MAKLTISKTYKDGDTPTQVDLDNICDSIETFLNVTQLGSDNIKANSVDASTTFSELSITTGKFATDSITTAKIINGAVTSSKIADGAVTTAKILNSAITTAKIKDGAITNAKIADNAVTADKKPQASGGSAGGLIQSTGALVTSTAVTDSFIRPNIFCVGGSALQLNSTSSGAVISAAYPIQKNEVTIQNNEFKIGPLTHTTSYLTFCSIPSSSLFSLDLIMDTVIDARRYRHGVKSNTAQTASSSGGNNTREII